MKDWLKYTIRLCMHGRTFHPPQPSHLHACHRKRHHARHKVRDRSGIHDAVNADKQRQNHNQRQQKENLARQGQENTLFRFSNRRKQVRRNRLHTV